MDIVAAISVSFVETRRIPPHCCFLFRVCTSQSLCFHVVVSYLSAGYAYSWEQSRAILFTCPLRPYPRVTRLPLLQ